MQTLGWGLPADARVQEACNVREVAAQRSQRLVRRMGGGHLGRQRWHYQAEAHDVSRHPAWTPTPRLDPESRFAPRRFSVVDFGCRSALRRGFKLARIWWRLIRPQNEGAGGVICVGSELLLVRASDPARMGLPGGGNRLGERRPGQRRGGNWLGNPPFGADAAANGRACSLWDSRRDRVHFFELGWSVCLRLSPTTRRSARRG